MINYKIFLILDKNTLCEDSFKSIFFFWPALVKYFFGNLHFLNYDYFSNKCFRFTCLKKIFFDNIDFLFFLLSEHILCKESIVIVKKFDFEILTYLYVLRPQEFIYAIFAVMHVCMCICACVCICVRM